ncbi:MAG: DEAD/DEAH box helicase [Planctomycetota bacterium]
MKTVNPSARSDNPNSSASKPAATKPAATKPAHAKSAPAATKPAATKPAASNPAASNTESANPATSGPSATPAFRELALHDALLSALVTEGYETPTPIQAQAIPPALKGRDLLGIAQTGTGKTAAFALPILNRLLGGHDPRVRLPVGRRPKALVLSPTRELAAQIGESFANYGRHTPLRHAVIFGGVGQGQQVRAISQGVDVLVATPGRLIDLMEQKLVDLRDVSFLVLDEADRMLDMGFIKPIQRIVAALPAQRQNMLFSATMPKEIELLARQILFEPVKVAVTPVATTVERIDQRLYFVLKQHKLALLAHLVNTEGVERAVVFSKTKHGADKLVRKLKGFGIRSEAIHGNKAQNQRTRALDAFRGGRVPLLVATDIAARGLDIDGITHVFNYDLPMEPEAYVHRIGRTARAGASGVAISFCDTEERDLLRSIEKLTRITIPRREMPKELPMPSDQPGAFADGESMQEHGDSEAREMRREPRNEPRNEHSARQGSRGNGAGRGAATASRGGRGPKAGNHPKSRGEPRSEGGKPQRHAHPASGGRSAEGRAEPRASQGGGQPAPASYGGRRPQPGRRR